MTDIPWPFSGKGNSQILSLAELKRLLSVIWILGKKKSYTFPVISAFFL